MRRYEACHSRAVTRAVFAAVAGPAWDGVRTGEKVPPQIWMSVHAGVDDGDNDARTLAMLVRLRDVKGP